MLEEWDDHGSPSWPVVRLETLYRIVPISECFRDATNNQRLQPAIFEDHPGTLTGDANLAAVGKRDFRHADSSVPGHREDLARIVPSQPINRPGVPHVRAGCHAACALAAVEHLPHQSMVSAVRILVDGRVLQASRSLVGSVLLAKEPFQLLLRKRFLQRGKGRGGARGRQGKRSELSARHAQRRRVARGHGLSSKGAYQNANRLASQARICGAVPLSAISQRVMIRLGLRPVVPEHGVEHREALPRSALCCTKIRVPVLGAQIPSTFPRPPKANH